MSSKTKTTATKEEATPALVLKLRFPGFSKPWAYDPLSKVLTEHKLKNTDGRDVFSVSMEYGIVNQIELLGRSFAAADTSHYTVGRRFDVVYTKSPLKAFPFGIVKQCKFDGEVALSPLYGVFTPSNPHLGSLIEAYFESPNRSKDFLSPLCQKGAKNTLQITNTTFLSGSLPLPTQPAEQQKIAECLSSVDELMAAQTRKVDALKTHKKGLMQQLFPREGETQPRLRFPEFEECGSWDEKALGELSTTTIGEFVIKTKQHPDAPYPVFNGGRSHTGFYEQFNNEGNKILISARGANAGYVNIIKRRYWAGNSCYSVSLNDPNDSLDFVYWFMKKNERTFTDNQHAANIPAVSKGHVEGFKIMLPSAEEQQRIAECLSSLDTLITAETQKHEALKTHKKGLMQQLFPSPEGVEA